MAQPRVAAMALLLASLPLPLGRSRAAAATPVVVIDAGHGGSNLGAFAPALQRHEKGLTLELAIATARALRREVPAARVLLTRQRDEYLTLQQRVRIANRAKATVFISLHFNASPTRTESGFECYVVSAAASEREAALIAARASGVTSTTGGTARPGGDVAAILQDLGQRATRTDAWQLAQVLRRALARARPGARDRGVRQAAFDVLLGLRMPGVLVEVGFVDHAIEGVELGRSATRQALAEALASAIATQLGGSSAPAPTLAGARGRGR